MDILQSSPAQAGQVKECDHKQMKAHQRVCGVDFQGSGVKRSEVSIYWRKRSTSMRWWALWKLVYALVCGYGVLREN